MEFERSPSVVGVAAGASEEWIFSWILFFHRAPARGLGTRFKTSVAVAVVVVVVITVVIGIAAPRTEDVRVRATVKRVKENNILLENVGWRDVII
jgi:hypothetical protein